MRAREGASRARVRHLALTAYADAVTERDFTEQAPRMRIASPRLT